jgi:hypothetical protein
MFPELHNVKVPFFTLGCLVKEIIQDVLFEMQQVNLEKCLSPEFIGPR